MFSAVLVLSMWGKAIYGVVGSALDKVQKVASDLESQLDAAVGKENDKVILDVNGNELSTFTAELQDDIVNESSDKFQIVNESSNKFQKDIIYNNGNENQFEPINVSIISDVKNDILKVDNALKLSDEVLLLDELDSNNSILEITKDETFKDFREHNLENSNSEKKFDGENNDLKENDDNRHSQIFLQKLSDLELNKLDNKEESNLGNEGVNFQNQIVSQQLEIKKLKFKLKELTEDMEKKIKGENLDYLNKLSYYDSLETELRNEIARLHLQIKDLTTKLSQNNEILSQREKSLESTSSQMSKLLNQVEQLEQANKILTESERFLKQQLTTTNNTINENDLKKQINRLQELIIEQDERLEAFESEGQVLAKRQGEMEKLVRKLKSEIKEKDNEISKSKDQRDQYVKAIEELQEVIRKNEADASTSNKSLIALQAVTQATSDKAHRLENELASRLDELSAVKKALESSWNEINEAKRYNTELKTERDELRRQLGEGTSKVIETEHNRREIEQREAILRATSKQLQESLQRQMTEASVREDRMRDELNEMRRRWQDAVASRENLSSELANATAPLLRQISSLQENLRIKSDQWIILEASLNERAIKAESALQHYEKYQTNAELQINSLTTQLDKLKLQYLDLQEINNKLNEQLTSLRNNHEAALYDLTQIKSQFELSRETYSSYEREQALLENKCSTIQQSYEEALETIQILTTTINEKNKELNILKSNHHSEIEPRILNTPHNLKKSTSLVGSPVFLPSGDSSFAFSERLQQQFNKKEEEVNALAYQLKQIQTSRDSLLEEVSYLSDKNSELEEKLRSCESKLIKQFEHQNDLLLTMLGEKQEEIEALLADMKEIKFLYQHEMESMINQILSNHK